MTQLEQALQYAEHDKVPVFPCIANGPRQKNPHTPHGFHDASDDPEIISAWWCLWPNAFIGMPTGRVSHRWVLDIDVKRPEANGFDTLADLGHSILPETPMVHTPSGGLHVYFDAGERELKNSAGTLGPGLDVRGDGGYVIVPSPGSGYCWDPQWNFRTVAPAPAPDWLWPVKVSRPAAPTGPITPTDGLSPYGRAAIEGAGAAIIRAGPGEQERTLNAECFSVGTLAGAHGISAAIALRALLHAASQMPNHDPAWPWRPEEIDLKVRRAFNAGLAQPRAMRKHREAG
jgi:Bifunctional DNA primase/polymerase, N-terminal